MKRLTALVLGLCALPAIGDEGRVFVGPPSAGRWENAAPGGSEPELAKGLPGRVSTRLVLRGADGGVVAEVVLLTRIPALRAEAFFLLDREIEALPQRDDGLLSLEEAIVRAASNLGNGGSGRERWWHWKSSAAFLEGGERFVFDGGLFPRWRVGIQYVKLFTGRTALLVYRVDARSRHARIWEQVREILRSPRLVRPA